jgi:hypothetical protein
MRSAGERRGNEKACGQDLRHQPCSAGLKVAVVIKREPVLGDERGQVITFQVLLPANAEQGLVVSVHRAPQIAGGPVAPQTRSSPTPNPPAPKEILFGRGQVRAPKGGLSQENAAKAADLTFAL